MKNISYPWVLVEVDAAVFSVREFACPLLRRTMSPFFDIPFHNLGDRWINAKRHSFDNNNKGEEWYNWQTALKIALSYGRSKI